MLVFVVEYEDRVVFLEINGHKHFRTDPPGSLLHALYSATLANEDRAADNRRLARVAIKRLAVSTGLKPRRSR